MHIWNDVVKGFSKMYNFSFFEKKIFCKHFYYITGICDKNFSFCKFAIFFADSKSRAQELSNDVSFVIFGHQTWDLEGESNWPPPAYPGFQVPQHSRVNLSPLSFTLLYSPFNPLFPLPSALLHSPLNSFIIFYTFLLPLPFFNMKKIHYY